MTEAQQRAVELVQQQLAGAGGLWNLDVRAVGPPGGLVHIRCRWTEPLAGHGTAEREHTIVLLPDGSRL